MRHLCLTFSRNENIFVIHSNIFVCSVETQHTIGYGGRQTTEECPEAIIIMCVQENVTKSPQIPQSLNTWSGLI